MIPAGVAERTRRFYEWELRGRGWETYPQPVALEPAFRPFLGHGAPSREHLDDGKRPTWLSSLVEQVRGENADRSDERDEPAEPQPQLDTGVGADLEEILIALPEDLKIQSTAVLGWLRALSAVSRRVSFELVGGGSRVEVRLAAARADCEHVLGQLRAALPEASVTQAPETLAQRWSRVSGQSVAAVEFGLAAEFMVPLAAPERHEEPLLPIIAALADIGPEELGLFQLLFEKTRRPWPESVLRAVVTSSGEPFLVDAPEITKLARDKLSTPLFAVALRIGAAAHSADRAWDIASRVASGLSRFGNPTTNELIPLPAEDPELLITDLLERTTHRSGMLLSAGELASLVHLPGEGVQVPELWRKRLKTKKATAEVTGAGCLVGRNEHEGETVEARLPVETKTKHVHVVGSSGTGKSTLLVRMILEDIAAGHGVGVLDPHGDLIDDVSCRVPDARLSDVVFFDPADETVVGWNILGAQSEVEKDLLASDLVGVFRRLSTSWGDQMTAVLANAILVFLESSRGGTLVDLRRFLVDERFRTEMLGTVADPHVVSFWDTEFPLLIGRKPQAPILTRLDTFLRSKLIRRVVTVRQPKLDFREVTDRGRIFLGKLSAGTIGEENAALLGSLLVSKFHQVTLARAGQVAESRRPFFLYIDEFHHVATPSMASLFSGMRKYGLGLTVAHQDLYQLHATVPEVERSLLANAYTRICFRVGEEDARQLAKGLSFFDAEDLMQLGLGEAICRVGGREANFNLSTDPLDAIDSDEAQQRRETIRSRSGARWGEQPVEETRPADQQSPGETVVDVPEADVPETRDPAVSERAESPDPIDASPDDHRQLDKATLDYLELVATDPFLNTRQRNRELDLSAWRGQRLKRRLVREGLVREVAINPGGRGERFKLLELTRAGRQQLATYGISPSVGHGRGGIAHQWWVKTITAWLSEHGISAAIEDDSLGVRVDLAFSLRRKHIAVEIETSDGHVVENVQKDLAAGFDSVISLLDDPGAVDRVEEKLSSEAGEVPAGVLVGHVQDYAELLEPLLSPHPALRPPNQNQEPRARRRLVPRRPAPTDVPVQLFEPGALSTPLAADYLGLSPATLETLRCRGGGPPFVKLGRRVVYRREDLDSWLAGRRRRSTSDEPEGP